MFVNGDPIDRLSIFAWPVGVTLVMLHVDGVVVGLRKATRDRLSDSKEPIEQLGAKERVMDKIMSNAVDVRVDHQRVNESKDQHYPERRVRVKEEEPQEISEMKQARRSSVNHLAA